MKNKDLIKALKKLPPETEIKVAVPEYWEGTTDYRDPLPRPDEDGRVIL